MRRIGSRQASAPIFPGGRLTPWFLRNRFALMRALVDEPRTTDEVATRARFDNTLRHASAYLSARLVVTIMLAFGVVASLTSVLFAALADTILSEGADAAAHVVTQVGAWADSASLFLLVLRMGIERALTRFDIVAAFLAAHLRQ